MIDIEKILPIWKVESGTMISMQGDKTIAYELDLPEFGTQSAQDFEAGHQAFVKAMRGFLPGTIFHKLDWFTKMGVQADSKRAAEGMLGAASEKHFAGRPYLDHRCYIFLTLQPSGRKLSSSAYSNILRKSIAPVELKDERLFQNFMAACGQFERILADSGLFSLSRLADDELAGTANKAGIIEQYCFLLNRGQQPVIRDIHIKDEIRVGDKHVELYTLADAEDLPALCGSRINFDKYSTDRTKYSIGFASPLGQFLDCDHIYNQFVFIGDTQHTIKQLEAKKLRLQSLSAYSRENAISRDACNDFLNEAIGQQRLPVKAHFNVLAWSDNPIDQAELKNKVGSAMAQMDAVCKQETDGAPQVWYAGMPGNEADFPMNDTFDTFAEQATCFFNLEGMSRSDGSGLRLGDRSYGRPVHIDLFNAPMKSGLITNRNLFVCGSSGAGKSLAMNHLLRSLYEEGTHCVTIDIGGSYKGLCDLVGGYYFTYTEDNPIQFNPFYIGADDVLDVEKKESLKTLLLALWKKDSDNYSRSEYVAISGAINLYYEHLAANPDVFPGFNSFYDFLLSEYMEVLQNGDVKEKDFDLGNFVYVLNPYYKGGEFDYLLNATENLDLLNERFIVFELDNIKSHEILFPVVTIIIMEMFISKMRKLKGKRKILAIDEAWVAIAKSGMAHFIKFLYKTIRKFNGIAALITQEVEDLISSPIIKETVINLSDTKILLDMRKFMNKFDKIQEVLGLSDKAKTMLLSLNKSNEPGKNYREIFVDQGGQSMHVYRNELCLEEYLAYTTEEKEKMKVTEYAARFGDIAGGIASLAAEIRLGKSVL
ncbi:TraG family conjugative transposon ATPase [Mucilaginibacter sp. ZT4R22]|uniref:TraG family conjugative transposon ATPase n=1 Tax=Mucilaginibacter pankratovii TaxID=2772110 RepID=A0ABR7WWA1_9SPHI|nr:TraG family conjugative transposon ATPase [Mucilaginibacter pankratovii]MBD1366569.1 TraG family conjugative transposon ATPase [Mucilaginibacter pankratovii]